MFEQAGAAEVAAEIRREQERLALSPQICGYFSRGLRKRPAADMQMGALFDIPNFLDQAVRQLSRKW